MATTSSFAVRSLSEAELGPTMIVNVPGSTTRFMSSSRNESLSGVTLNCTLRVCPGSRCTRLNPFNSFTGRVTVDTSSRMYSSTISSPARAPALVTSKVTVVCPAGPVRSGVTRRFEYL